jgi:cytochrome b
MLPQQSPSGKESSAGGRRAGETTDELRNLKPTSVRSFPKMSAHSARIIRVWDLPTRVFHWSLATAVIGLLITGRIGGDAMIWHSRLGYSVASLLLARMAWGFVGGHWSRFHSFAYSPRSVVDALRVGADPYIAVGHSARGALSVYAMLAFLMAQAGTGLFSDDQADFSGPLSVLVSNHAVRLITGYHKNVGQWALITLALLHVGAIAYYWIRKRENLVRPMWTGDKVVSGGAHASRDDWKSRLLAALLLLLASAVVGWIASVGS